MKDQCDGDKRHDRQVLTIMNAIASTAERYAAAGLTPEAVFEGAVKGGAACLLAGTTLTAREVGELIVEIGEAFEKLESEGVHAVQ